MLGPSLRWRQAVPNGLTLLRLFMAPAFPFVPAAWRMPMLALGLLSEYLDGYLARRLDGASDFGRVLDPIADKVFVFAVVLVLVLEGYASPGRMAFVLARDIVVVLAVLWYFLSGGQRRAMPRVEPTLLGKVVTAAQIAFLILVLGLERSPLPLVIAVGVLSLWSGLTYLRDYREHLLPSRRQ